MLLLRYKKVLIRVLLITVGFFSTHVLFRTTDVAGHIDQIQNVGYCYVYSYHSDGAYGDCSSQLLGDKPYWNPGRKDEYKFHWVAESYQVKNELLWHIEIIPWDGLGIESKDPTQVFALRVKLTYPMWWNSWHVTKLKISGVAANWSELKPVGSSDTLFETYTPLTKALVGRIAKGENIQLLAELEVEQEARPVSILLPAMSRQTYLDLMEPQQLADDVSRQINEGKTPKIVNDQYGLKFNGESLTLILLAGEKPLAHWPLKKVKRSVTYSSGSKYMGFIEAGKRNGQGRYTWVNGDVYSGEWLDGQRTGQGVLTWANGDSYNGDWIKDQRTGQGTINWINGDSYSGDWIDHQRTGQGRYSWANGDSYIGGWKNGQRDGKGVFTWKDGRRYEGEYQSGVMHGYGVLSWPDGRHYEGGFLKGKRTGRGEYISSRGGKYQGEFVDGERHGYGLYKSYQGWSYEGDWKDNKRHGHGDYVSSSGQHSYREYYRGERIKEPEPEVSSRNKRGKRCGSYDNPCQVESDTGIDGFMKGLARATNEAFGSGQYGGSGSNSAAQIQAENEKRWRAYDRKLKREAYEANAAAERRRKERAAKKMEYNRHNGTCDDEIELDDSAKSWRYIWSAKVCGRWDCDGRSNNRVETRVFVSNLVYARKYDHDNLNGAFYDQIRIQYKHKTHSASGTESNGYVCRGDARNARRKFIAERSDNDRTFIFDVNLPEYP